MLTALILLASTVTALVLVLLAVVVVGIRREPPSAELSSRASSLTALVVRRLLGVYVSKPDRPPADNEERACPGTRTVATTRGGDGLAISLSLVLVLAVAVWLLQRYAGLKILHGLICALFGFYLSTSSLAPDIRTTVTAVIHALTGHG